MTLANVGRGEPSEWVQVHEVLSRLARERAAADAEEGRWLLRALRSAVHVHVGFGSFGEYVERLFGYKWRSTQEKLRVAQALEGLPGMARALDAGSLSWSAVREITRVAVAETEHEWLEVAQGRTVRQLEELVVGKSPGDRPTMARSPGARRHVLRFEVAPETFALFREAISQLRRRSGTALDDDSALLSMARQVLGGPPDDGRASYQISLSVCEQCGSGHQPSSGEFVSVGADVLAMASATANSWGTKARPPRTRIPQWTAVMPTKTLHGCRESTPMMTRPAPMWALTVMGTLLQAVPTMKVRADDWSAAKLKPKRAPASRVSVFSWAHARSKPSRPRYAAQCLRATTGAVVFQAVGTPPFSICTTSICVPRAAGTRLRISSRSAERIIVPCIAGSSSFGAAATEARASGTPTAASMPEPPGRRRSRHCRKFFARCAASGFAKGRSVRWSRSCKNGVSFERHASKDCCERRCSALRRRG